MLLVAAVLFTLIGIGFGTFTGLVPGIHVNTVAALILVFSSAFLGLASTLSSAIGVPPIYAPILLSVTIVANLTTHTFLDFIPSAILGAPDEDMALSVLPAHRMMLKGLGERAVRLSASGSIYSILMGLSLLLPAYIFFGLFHGYEMLKPYIPLILVCVVSILILAEYEKGRMHPVYALSVFLLSGAYGWVVLNGGLFDGSSLPFEDMRESAPIFSGLLGLFGLPALIQSMGVTGRIKQREKGGVKALDERKLLRKSFVGAVSGAFVGWFPGITSASATVLASTVSKDMDEEGFITAMSAVNTSNALFVILALFVIGKARSGALKIVQILARPDIWNAPTQAPSFMFLLLFSAALSGAVAYPLTVLAGKFFLARMEKVEYRRISQGIIVFLIFLCLLLAGPVGIYIAAIGAMLGLIPPLIGVNRVHLMGFLIIPVIIYLSA